MYLIYKTIKKFSNQNFYKKVFYIISIYKIVKINIIYIDNSKKKVSLFYDN